MYLHIIYMNNIWMSEKYTDLERNLIQIWLFFRKDFSIYYRNNRKRLARRLHTVNKFVLFAILIVYIISDIILISDYTAIIFTKLCVWGFIWCILEQTYEYICIRYDFEDNLIFNGVVLVILSPIAIYFFSKTLRWLPKKNIV